MDPAIHDRIFAATSHLPHVLAYTLVDMLARVDAQMRDSLFAYAAGGFRDFTRIASSSPKMWHDIVRANKTNVVAAIDQYLAALTELQPRPVAATPTMRPRCLDVFARARCGARAAHPGARASRGERRRAPVSGSATHLARAGGRRLRGRRCGSPATRSIFHRAVMFAALAESSSRIEGFLDGEDCLCLAKAFQGDGRPGRSTRPPAAWSFMVPGSTVCSAPRDAAGHGQLGDRDAL